jgi:hypothetical protein
MTEKNERAQAWLDKIHAEHDRQIAQQWADDDTCRHAAEHIVIHELLSEIDQAKAQAESAVTPQVEQAVQALLDDFGRITDDQGCWSDAHVEDLERICRMHIQQAISTSLTGSRETPPSVVIALKELVEAVAREVDTEGKGGSGYLLARLTDARAALKAVPQDAAPRVSDEPPPDVEREKVGWCSVCRRMNHTFYQCGCDTCRATLERDGDTSFCTRLKGHEGDHWTKWAPKPFSWPAGAVPSPPQQKKNKEKT